MIIRVAFSIIVSLILICPTLASKGESADNTLVPVKASIDISPENWKNPKFSELLKQGKVISMRPMRDYLQSQGKKVNYKGNVFLVDLDNGFKCVFKNVPDADFNEIKAEVAAYQASIVLGFPNIPPTIISEMNGITGSLQLFVETKIDANSKTYPNLLKEAHLDDVANLKLFYFIFGQWDSGPPNILVLKDGAKVQLIAIDNGAICDYQHVRYGDLPFIKIRDTKELEINDEDNSFPFHKAKSIESPSVDKLKECFGDIFPGSYLNDFVNPRYLPYRYVIYKKSIWRQYWAGNEEFVKSFSDYLPCETAKKLNALNMDILKEIFSHTQEEYFLNHDYLAAILERRDQVLRYFNS